MAVSDRTPGRPSKLDEDTQAKVCAALRTGNFVRPACEFAGISQSTYYAWRERGEADREAGLNTPFLEFLEATTRASAEGELLAVSRLAENVRNGDQRAIEFFLTHRHSERWSHRVHIEHRGQAAELPPAPEPIDPEEWHRRAVAAWRRLRNSNDEQDTDE
jgi:hypothetical protein